MLNPARAACASSERRRPPAGPGPPFGAKQPLPAISFLHVFCCSFHTCAACFDSAPSLPPSSWHVSWRHPWRSLHEKSLEMPRFSMCARFSTPHPTLPRFFFIYTETYTHATRPPAYDTAFFWAPFAPAAFLREPPFCAALAPCSCKQKKASHHDCGQLWLQVFVLAVAPDGRMCGSRCAGAGGIAGDGWAEGRAKGVPGEPTAAVQDTGPKLCRATRRHVING